MKLTYIKMGILIAIIGSLVIQGNEAGSSGGKKKKIIIKVPSKVKHIYHHHTQKVHIYKEKPKPKTTTTIKTTTQAPIIKVVKVKEEVHPIVKPIVIPKWKPIIIHHTKYIKQKEKKKQKPQWKQQWKWKPTWKVDQFSGSQNGNNKGGTSWGSDNYDQDNNPRGFAQPDWHGENNVFGGGEDDGGFPSGGEETKIHEDYYGRGTRPYQDGDYANGDYGSQSSGRYEEYSDISSGKGKSKKKKPKDHGGRSGKSRNMNKANEYEDSSSEGVSGHSEDYSSSSSSSGSGKYVSNRNRSNDNKRPHSRENSKHRYSDDDDDKSEEYEDLYPTVNRWPEKKGYSQSGYNQNKYSRSNSKGWTTVNGERPEELTPDVYGAPSSSGGDVSFDDYIHSKEYIPSTPPFTGREWQPSPETPQYYPRRHETGRQPNDFNNIGKPTSALSSPDYFRNEPNPGGSVYYNKNDYNRKHHYNRITSNLYNSNNYYNNDRFESENNKQVAAAAASYYSSQVASPTNAVGHQAYFPNEILGKHVSTSAPQYLPPQSPSAPQPASAHNLQHTSPIQLQQHHLNANAITQQHYNNHFIQHTSPQQQQQQYTHEPPIGKSVTGVSGSSGPSNHFFYDNNQHSQVLNELAVHNGRLVDTTPVYKYQSTQQNHQISPEEQLHQNMMKTMMMHYHTSTTTTTPIPRTTPNVKLQKIITNNDSRTNGGFAVAYQSHVGHKTNGTGPSNSYQEVRFGG